MRTLAILFFLAMGLQAQAQVLLVNMNFGDCTKCLMHLEQLKPGNIHVPSYVVFDEDMVDDRDDIEEKYGFEKMGFKAVYSNALHAQIQSTGSSVSLLGTHGELLFRQSLFDLQQQDIEQINKLLEAQPWFQYKEKYITNIKDGKMVHWLQATNSFTVLLVKDTVVYKLAGADMTAGLELLFADGKTHADKYTAFYSRQPFLKPAFTTYSGYKGSSWLLGKFHAEVIKGRDTALSYHYALYQYKGRALQHIYPLELPALDTTIFDDIFFVVKNDSTFLFCYYPQRQPEPGRYTPFIATFGLSEGKVRFNRWLDIDLPQVYKQYVGYNYMSFRIVDYPYCIFNLATEIIDLDKEQSHAYTLPVKPDFSTLKADGIRQLSNELMYHDAHNGKIYILGTVQGRWKLMSVQAGSWQLADYTDLGSRIPSVKDNTRFLHIDTDKGMFYAPDDKGMVRGYPLSLVLAK